MASIKKKTNFEVKNAWPIRDSVSPWGPFPAIPSPYPFLCFLLANDTLWSICAGRPVYGPFLCIMSSFCSCSVFFQVYPLLLSMTPSLINLPSDSWTLAAGTAYKVMHMVTPTFQCSRSSNTDALMHGVKSSPCFHRSPVITLGFHVGTTVN